jgi:steroid Delta-isomerase
VRNEEAMLDEIERKEIIQEYYKRLNAGDADGVVDMFAEDGTVEDPVGYEPRGGRRALHDYYRFNVAECKIQVAVEKIVAAQDGRHVAVAVTADSVNYMDPEKSTTKINAVLTFQINDAGLIEEMRSFWSFKDFEAA